MAGIFCTGVLMTKSGVPIFHLLSENTRGAGALAGSPWLAIAAHPILDQAPLLGGHAAMVRELAVLAAGIPGGHPLFGNHLGDHRGVIHRVLIARQRERRFGRAGVMAILAMLLQQRRDVFG